MDSLTNFPPRKHRTSITVAAISTAFIYTLVCSVPVVVEGAFVSSGSHRLPLISRMSSRPIPLAMSTDNSDSKNEGDGEVPISGSFFNAVPPKKDESSDSTDEAVESQTMETEITSSVSAKFSGEDVDMFEQIIEKTKISRSGGGVGFAKAALTSEHISTSVIQTTDNQKFVGIGKPLNDIQNPEYDANGYTLYADETTGEKKRVFEALVEYPSVFKMKIVGQDDENETFAQEIVQTIAKSCGVDISMVKHSKRKNGKWTSVTVHAPVRDADMLYSLYEDVDQNPRVKFKF